MGETRRSLSKALAILLGVNALSEVMFAARPEVFAPVGVVLLIASVGLWYQRPYGIMLLALLLPTAVGLVPLGGCRGFAYLPIWIVAYRTDSHLFAAMNAVGNVGTTVVAALLAHWRRSGEQSH